MKVQEDVAPQKNPFNDTILHQKSNWAQLILIDLT